MRLVTIVLVLLALSSCGRTYSDLESAFRTDTISKESPLSARTIVLTSRLHRGAESYHGLATIRLSADSVDIDMSMPFKKPIRIPTDQIAGCSMTCFGTDDQHVDLLVPKVEVDIMIPSSEELLNWCWSSKRPMFPSSVRRAWQYKGSPLPPASDFKEQLDSRQSFDKQKTQSCLGY